MDCIKITVTPKFIRCFRSCDGTGRRMTEDEVNRAALNPHIGNAEIIISTPSLKIARTIGKVWKNRDGVGVTFPADTEFADDVLQWVTKACIQAMHGVETSEWFG